MKLVAAQLARRAVGAGFGLLVALSIAPCGAAGLHGEVKVEYVSEYISTGWKLSGDPCLQPGVTLEPFTPDIQLMYWGSYPLRASTSDSLEHDFVVRLSHTFLPERRGAFRLQGYADYWSFPRQERTFDKGGEPIPETTWSGFKFNAGVALPRLIPIGKSFLVPVCNAFYWTPAERDLFRPGAAYEPRLVFDHPLPFKAGRFQTIANLVGSVMYHDGAFGMPEEWTHATFHAGVTFRAGSFSVRPHVNYQWSLADDLPHVVEDQFWVGMLTAYRF